MADEDPQQPEPGAGGPAGPLPGLQGAEAGALQLRIKSSICKSVQSKVENILQDVEKFSDIEKLYLYLQLPSGPNSTAEKSDQSALLSSRTQQTHAFNWIRDHLEEYPETSLPKQEVYDEYKSFCDNLNYPSLSAADFGKMMKNVFPNMKARRLGMRGKSKYCYSGLRKRPYVHMPSLPTLDLHKTPDGLHCDVLDSPCQLSSIKEEVRFAACDLVCEWAQKVLKRQFDAVEDLARFLIDSHYISNKSLAALTIMTSTATEAKAPPTISAFIPTSEAHPFQPQVTMFSSPSVDAKQQLQRKIQRKQQEQKLHSPLPGDGQTKRVEDIVPCSSPTTLSPQPTIGIVVAAVPSPITVQKNSQLMSPSPVGAVESKVLPFNFQMVSQPLQAVKQGPKPIQTILTGPVGERTARQRYAQILPKPSVTSAITLRSPSTMIITNSPIKTVMTTCHVSPMSLVKMAAISLAPTSTETTSLTNATLQPTSAGITSAVPILAPVTKPGPITDPQGMDVEMEVEAIHKSSQMQSSSSQVLTQGANRARGAVQRAASVPIPQTKGFLGLEEISNTSGSGKALSGTNTVAQSSNNSSTKTSTLHLSSPTQNTSTVTSVNTSRLSLFEGLQAEQRFLSTKSPRKRSGLSPDRSAVKRVFIPQQPVDGTPEYNFKSMAGYVSSSGTTGRPESAPVMQDVEMKMSSVLSTQVDTQSTSSVRASCFDPVAKTHSSTLRSNTSIVMETDTSVGDVSIQEQPEHTVGNMYVADPGFQKRMCSNSITGNLEGGQHQTYVQSDPANDALQILNQASSSQLMAQKHMDYFSFDDDVTQDSIVEELVQMEEQMKLKQLQQFGNCGSRQGQHALMPDNVTSTSQAMTAFYHAANNSSHLIQTPTPTSEMMGGAQNFTSESPCSHIASTTPVDSALGSSRHTPVGNPHSNCSSSVPPSPVECRNPFAFMPINSSMTCFHENGTISRSPVKPMQRPMATHPDKARLEWMSNSYSSSTGGGGTINKSNSGMGILTGYQGLIDEHFQKPHAFAVPHARHHDSHCGRLTPISPVQLQVASMSNKQEGFAVPAPLDNKTSNTSTAAFRCRSVSPAVHQKNLSGNNALPNVPRSMMSPFSSPVMPEALNIFSNSKTNPEVSSIAQRSRSVPVNIMMQSEVLPAPNHLCSSQNITSVLLNKLEGDNGDSMRGLGIHNLPSTYTARMNLTQILDSKPSFSCTDNQMNPMTPNSASSCISQRPNYLLENTGTVNKEMILSAGNSQTAFGEQHQSLMLAMSSQQQQIDFGSTRHLLTDGSLTAGSQLLDQVSELTAGGPDFPCEIRMTSELSSSINDLNALDTNLLFDPNQQQSKYENAAAEELFQQMSEMPHSGGLEWLESKDHPAVGLMG